MIRFLLLVLSILAISCQSQESKTDKYPQPDFAQVTKAVSDTLSRYLYNSSEMESDAYGKTMIAVDQLAKTAKDKGEFIEGFNTLWQEGPFSHVRMAEMEQPSSEMAAYIDNLNMGENAVSLEWKDKSAILVVNTMTGDDTKNRIVEAYREIHEREAESLTIDLRNNEGGTFAGIPLAGHITHEPRDVGVFVSRQWWDDHNYPPTLNDLDTLIPWEGWSIKTFWQDVQHAPLTRIRFQPMTPQFTGPVYILISNKTASAAEFTADALASQENVTILGERSAGEMLSQKMYDLPLNLQLSLPIAEYYSTRMGRIEGQGVSPDIEVDARVALNLAELLIQGEELENALAIANSELKNLQKEPLNGVELLLMGSMNEWGKKWNETPHFEHRGNGVFEANVTLDKGEHEFKIAPMSWEFDYGSRPGQWMMEVGQEATLIRKPGSPNLKLYLEQETTLLFRLDVSDENNGILSIMAKG